MTDADIFTDKDLEIDARNEEKFIKKKRKELLKAEERQRKHELKLIHDSNRYDSPTACEVRSKRTTTKILIYFILFNCTIVEIYSMVVMYKLNDLSALYSLIGAVIGESITYAIYCAKSHMDTREEKKNDLERDKWEATQESCDDSEDDTSDDNLEEDPIPEDDDGSGDIPEGEIEITEEIENQEG